MDSITSVLENIVRSTGGTTLIVDNLKHILNNCNDHVNLFNLAIFPHEFLKILLDKVNTEKTLNCVNIIVQNADDSLKYVLENLTSIPIESIVIVSRAITQESINVITRFVHSLRNTLKHITFNFTDAQGRFSDDINILGLLDCIQFCSSIERLSIMIPRTADHVTSVTNILLSLEKLTQLRLRFSADMSSLELTKDYSDSKISLLSDVIINHKRIVDMDFTTFVPIDDEIEFVKAIMKGNTRISRWSLMGLDLCEVVDTIGVCDHIRSVDIDTLHNHALSCWQILQIKHIHKLEFYKMHEVENQIMKEYIESVLEENTTLLKSYTLSNFSTKCESFIARNNKKHAVEKMIEIVPSLHKRGLCVFLILEIVMKLLPSHPAITPHFVMKTCSRIIGSIEKIKQ